MSRAAFDRNMPPHWWDIPRRSPSEPPRGYAWRRAVEPGPLNGPMYVPRRDEIVFISPWAGRDSYDRYEEAILKGHHVHYRVIHDPDRQSPPFLFLVTGFQPLPHTPFAWLQGFRCTTALRVPQGKERRIWVRMTEVISVTDAENRGLLPPLDVGNER